MMCVCVITWIEWKMDGWIGLSGCGKWMESGCGKWKVASGAVPDLTQIPHCDCDCDCELFLLPFCENGRPPYWNCTSAFDLWLLIVLGMTFWFRLPNVIQIGLSTAELWHHIHLSEWRPAAILDFVWIILYHPRSPALGPNLVYIWSQSDSQFRRYCHFQISAFYVRITYLRCYFRRACAESRFNLLSWWKLSTYLDLWVDLPSQHQISISAVFRIRVVYSWSPPCLGLF